MIMHEPPPLGAVHHLGKRGVTFAGGEVGQNMKQPSCWVSNKEHQCLLVGHAGQSHLPLELFMHDPVFTLALEPHCGSEIFVQGFWLATCRVSKWREGKNLWSLNPIYKCTEMGY